MKKATFILLFIFIYSNASFGQTYYEQHKICSEILNDLTIGDSIFWEKLKVRDNCLIGLEIPPFEVTTLKNEKFKLDNLKGKVIVLNFWFTNCAPCIAEMPFLNNLVSEYKSDKVLFLSIANDEPSTLEKFLKTKKFDFEIVPKGSSFLTQTLKLFSAWPTTLIIDAEGKIRYVNRGALNDDEENFIKVLNESLK